MVAGERRPGLVASQRAANKTLRANYLVPYNNDDNNNNIAAVPH